MSTVTVIGTEPLKTPWTDRVTDWYQWERYASSLRANPEWTADMVESVARESLRILRRMPDPLGVGRAQGRGLVVGYVQSGKTANYAAVAARAADAGYRMVIVLSGIHDALRNQTQSRLVRELRGHGDSASVGKEWAPLTNEKTDFQGNINAALLQSPTAPYLIVAKKRTPILRKLDTWLAEGERFISQMPVLLVDDESDQASVNTKGNRNPDPVIRDGETADDEVAPSLTNALIRSILGRCRRVAYVAYTATPFANLLINPEATDRVVGDDLFPRDFVVQLPRPKGYTGTEEMFGISAQDRDILRDVPHDDVIALRGTTNRRGTGEVTLSEPSEGIPDTLCDALLAFCIAGGIRTIRAKLSGKPMKAHTMLVHVSHLTDDQTRISDAIKAQLRIWRAALDQGQDLGPVLLAAWNGIRKGVTDPADDATIIAAAKVVLRTLIVLELNSATGENLEYEEKPGRHIVAVGGNRLSRGLTLEGLTISYFLRTAAMVDTILQMARWYGFRRGYEDLIRLWTTDGISRWFTELALVEESLRDAINALDRAGRTPRQMRIRLRAHSDLMLTARNKSGMATTIRESWSSDHPQTVVLPLSDPEALVGNRTLTDAFLVSLPIGRMAHGGRVIRDVAPEAIAAYLRSYRVHEDIRVFQPDAIADWIMERSAADELTDWTVFVASPKQGKLIPFGGDDIGLVRRRRDSSESIGTLIDPRHEGVDLEQGPDAFRRESSYDAKAMRDARSPTQGLLIIYPLDPEPLGVTSVDTVVALALSLPKTSDAGADFIVNSGVGDE